MLIVCVCRSTERKYFLSWLLNWVYQGKFCDKLKHHYIIKTLHNDMKGCGAFSVSTYADKNKATVKRRIII
jgi:hypothetical protein